MDSQISYRVAEYSRYREKGGIGDWESGILNIPYILWNQYNDVIDKLLECGDFIWRGQRFD